MREPEVLSVVIVPELTLRELEGVEAEFAGFLETKGGEAWGYGFVGAEFVYYEVAGEPGVWQVERRRTLE